MSRIDQVLETARARLHRLAAEEVPAAHEIAVALAMRLLKDPDFHDQVLDWYYSQPDEALEEEE